MKASHIVKVGEEPHTLLAVVPALRKAAFRVTTATNGNEAVCALEGDGNGPSPIGLLVVGAP